MASSRRQGAILALAFQSAASALPRPPSFVSRPPPSSDDSSSTLPLSCRATVTPRVHVSKHTECLGCALTVAAEYDLAERAVSYEASLEERLAGGAISMRNQSVTWTKAWFFPGLTDAMTRLELHTSFDVRTGRADGRLRLGLRRRFSPKGLSLVHSLPVDREGRCKLEVGATLTVPDDLELSSDDVLAGRNSLRDARFGIDVDHLVLRLMY
uniref:Uncharacterized protein n=1 Tax=Calcidiscus leptoporus TaxID=127549 RepID=A0A7S0JET2_9EUKA|mmetsp:Transcript_53870/g.123995  ORF Transcript_53870/g.123995 Transcript_53870/m.123995 type:complete len:212 (+) Transcript_53870:27-662(+)|eukprot:CAMPEP_0119398962 /NCGR_PEP_ID=MMETSP1334-20130426/141116_1 /TAXON_ID=127549 /ORGANISM="Calcidiscus leptoporus, Strain RCC1130" /LENGTH=211 /DNA_ID=CAMNT_0007422845 /DNA_START=497 /DNA_END=1132 /DNA_ORIENTATION=-